jgi:hypothetical protein
VILHNLRHSNPPTEIQAELATLGHKVRIVLNIRHHVTKDPLQLYFVDLETQENNKRIYDLQLLRNMKINVEAPRKKIISSSARRSNSMGTPKATAPARMSASSVGANTIRHLVYKRPWCPSHVCPMQRGTSSELQRMYYIHKFTARTG